MLTAATQRASSIGNAGSNSPASASSHRPRPGSPRDGTSRPIVPTVTSQSLSLLEQRTEDHPFLGEPDPEWRDSALCREGINVDFFPFSEDITAIRRVKEVCAVCPVAEDCLTYAMQTRQSEGVWGGLTSSERVSLRRKWAGHTRNLSELKAEDGSSRVNPRVRETSSS